jgi:hypothetical protein
LPGGSLLKLIRGAACLRVTGFRSRLSFGPGIELAADQDRDAREVEPEHEDDHARPPVRAARRFYMHFGFEPSPTDEMHLMLLLKDARAAAG